VCGSTDGPSLSLSSDTALLSSCSSASLCHKKIFEAITKDSVKSHVIQAVFTARRNARIASAVLAIAIPYVRHTPVLCQNDGKNQHYNQLPFELYQYIGRG